MLDNDDTDPDMIYSEDTAQYETTEEATLSEGTDVRDALCEQLETRLQEKLLGTNGTYRAFRARHV